jgi:Zn-finger nucleic acid-binding protein
MRGEVSYRQIVLYDNGETLRLPLTAPMNDLLGQLRPSAKNETGYLPYLSVRYQLLAIARGTLGDALNRDVQQTFLRAAREATKGHVSAELAPYLERLRFVPDGTVDDVPDLSALAAWSLLEAVRRQPLELRTCPQCKGRWLARPDESTYCQRVAPGQVTKDCRTLDREKRIAGDSRYRAYRREYKRLDEAFRRRAIDAKELIAWRDQNGPAKWLPFDQWKARRKRRARKERT